MLRPPTPVDRLARLRSGAAALACMLVLAACGGGGGGASDAPPTPLPPPTDGLPDQAGCFYQYTLSVPALRSGADPLMPALWHLLNSGQDGGTAGEDLNALPAWNDTRGAGARIAVVDDAVDLLHEDLAPNVVAGASYSYRPGTVGNPYPLPCQEFDDHGTAIAGIALARDQNAVGVAGVAPRAGLVAYGALATGYDADLADALMRGLADNGVYQNSWGSPDSGQLGEVSSAIMQAIDTGIATGRNGKGAIYVFAGGNGGCFATDSLGGCYDELSTLDGYLNHRGVIVACGVDHDGRHPQYAEKGANLLVCGLTSDDAYHSTITTTAPQNAYRNDFSGTSASTPMVSGVAALVLAANPALSWRDLRLILAHSARRNDPTDPGWTASGFGPAFNPKYGFGVVDAQAAVTLARTWQSVGTSETLRSCGPYRRSPNIPLPDASGGNLFPREDSIVIDAQCPISRIEYVEVEFTASHPYSGDLHVELFSPNALASELAPARVCEGSGDACGAYSGWRFGSVRHLDEPPAGTWRLRVTDEQALDTGIWQAWSLRIWGR